MFQIKTKKIEEVVPENPRNKPENPFHTTNYYKKTKSVHDQLMNCRCWHGYYVHRLCKGKCDAPYCICEEFVQGAVEIWDYKENYIEIDDRKYEGGLF